MSQHDLFNHVLTSLHDAMLDDAHWPATSALIDEACAVKGSLLMVGEEQYMEQCKVLLARFCVQGQRREDWERWYFKNYHPWNESAPRIIRLPHHRLVSNTDVYTESELKNSRVYNEALPRGNFQNGLYVRLPGPDGTSVIWNLQDSAARDGGWGSAQIDMIERLLPHVRQFVQVRHAVAGASALRTSLRALLDNTRIGVIHLDRRGRIVEANDYAHVILRRGDGLCEADGLLRARLSSDNDRLGGLLEGALPAFGQPAVSGSMTVRRSPGRPQLLVHLSPVSAHQVDFGFTPVAALMLVVDPGRRRRVDANLVSSVLGLTKSESQVAVLLAEGLPIRAIANTTQRQTNTVYWLLKQAYAKLGISRQADLVRLVLSLTEP